jgi:hypothetical protein
VKEVDVTENSASTEIGSASLEASRHVPRYVSKEAVREIVHGTSAVGRFNSQLALLITKGVGTMWCAYVFAVVALFSFPQAFAALQKGDTLVAVQWLSQSFLQLVLLPIIIVGQNVISQAQDSRAEADHETLTTIHRMNVQQLRILENEEKILRLLEARSEGGPQAAGPR